MDPDHSDTVWGVGQQRDKYQLLNNSRFYVLVMSILVSITIFAWLRLQIPSDQLFFIRVQQVFGLLCVLYWYVALIISPVGYVVGKQRMRHIEFARRAIGVSAAYFALLHGSVALWGQLGGIGQLTYLPPLFKWSLLGGLFALVILLVMAATSFDKVVKFMTFKHWKLLHRLVYIGGILAVLHIWTIGTHLAYTNIQWTAFVALVTLSGLETFRGVTLFAKKHLEFQSKDYFITLFVSVWLLWVVLIAAIPTLVQNYHSRHNGHSSTTHNEVKQ